MGGILHGTGRATVLLATWGEERIGPPTELHIRDIAGAGRHFRQRALQKRGGWQQSKGSNTSDDSLPATPQPENGENIVSTLANSCASLHASWENFASYFSLSSSAIIFSLHYLLSIR